jgi:hypothetical protein
LARDEGSSLLTGSAYSPGKKKSKIQEDEEAMETESKP